MINKITYILLFAILTSCSDGASDANKPTNISTEQTLSAPQNTISAVSYRMISTEDGEDDASLAQGYWQSLTSYPELNGQIKEPVKIKINEAIIKLSKEYSCETYGDYSFSSDVTFINSELFSMTYEIMWLCPKMASPDSTIGALNYNLLTGEVIHLESEFANASAHNDLLLMLSNKLSSQNKDNKDCPAKDKYSYFYKTKTSLFFVADVQQHSDSGCITEIEISKDEMTKYLKAESLLLK